MTNPMLAEKNAQMAAVISQLVSVFNRSYNFNKEEDQAIFFEGMSTIGKHCALNSRNAQLKVEVGSDGIYQIVVDIQPNPL